MNAMTNTFDQVQVPFFDWTDGTDAEVQADSELYREEQKDDQTGATEMEQGAMSDRVSEPTLFVGIGGTGIQTCTRIKAGFIESHGKLPSNVAIMCIDSADDPVSYRENRFGSIVTLERGNEFFMMNKVPVSGIKRRPNRHPEIFGRLGRQNVEKINRAFIGNGAAAQRPQGLMAYVWNAKRIEEILDNKLHRLTERTKNLRYELEGKTALKVFVIGSIAGGQGAGAILDATYVIREKLMELGNLGESSTIVGVLLLPGAFHEIETQQMRANAYAFIQELNSLMLGKLAFDATYPGGAHIHSTEPPFDHLYLFDGVDENGKSWANQDALCGLMARTAWLLASSQVGAREINSMINESGVLLGVSEDGYGTFNATAGQAVIRWPAHEVAERCAVRYAQAMIDQLEQQLDQQTIQTDAEDLIDPTALRALLTSNADGAPYPIRLSAPAALDQMPVDETPAQARMLVENYFQRRLYDDYFEQMQAKEDKLAAPIIQEVQTRITSMLNNGELVTALGWLRPTIGTMKKTLSQVTAEQTRVAQLVEQRQLALDSAAVAMDHAAGGLITYVPFVGRTQLQSALNAYLDEAAQVARLQLTQRAEQLIVQAVHRVIDVLHDKQRKIQAAILRLQQANLWLKTQEAAFARRSSGQSEISLAEPGLIDHFYHRFAGDSAPGLHAAIGDGTEVLTWGDWKVNDLALHLVSGANARFAPVLKLTVEDVLSLRWTDRSAQQWTERLQELAAGAWNLDHALLKSGGVGMASFLTIGVPDESNTIFANCGHSLVSTHDPERIVALRTVYGASADTLKPFGLWKRAYDRLAPHVQLHTLGDFQNGKVRTAQIFALGMAFDFIYNKGPWHYYQPADELVSAVRFDQGLGKSLQKFSDSAGLQQEIMARVDARIAAEGTAKAVARISAWINDSNKSDETLSRLRRAARDFVDELQLLQGPSQAGK